MPAIKTSASGGGKRRNRPTPRQRLLDSATLLFTTEGILVIGIALFADALGTTVGAVFGTSPTTAYIESGTGVAVGGRTGLTTITVAVLFFLSSFFYPVVSVLASAPAVTAPALIIVGSMMIGEAANINWEDLSEGFPAFLVIITMPLTSSIATGLALGFMTYPITKFIKGQSKEVHPLIYVFAVLFFIQLFLLGGH